MQTRTVTLPDWARSVIAVPSVPCLSDLAPNPATNLELIRRLGNGIA